MTATSFNAFGLRVSADLPLGLVDRVGHDGPWVDLRPSTDREIAAAWSSSRALVWRAQIDGAELRVHHGARGDHLFAWGDAACFHVSAGGDLVLCAPADFEEHGWRRVLLDSVLFSVSLLHGFEALHASAVVDGGRLIAFAGPPGAGKTSLAGALLATGARLFADDVVALRREGAELLAYPGPPVANVPAERASERGGTLLARFPDCDEVWVRDDAAWPAPAPVATVGLLARGAGAAAQVRRAPRSPLALVPHLLGFPHLDTDRDRMRFEAAADLAAQADLIEVQAGTELEPAGVAALVRAHTAQAEREEVPA